MATKTKPKKPKKHPRPQRVDFIREYGVPVGDLRLDEQEFRLVLVRPGQSDLPIDGYVEGFEWRDEGAAGNVNITPVLRGQLNLRKPQVGTPGSGLKIERGSVVRCDVRWAGRWEPLWQMRVGKPSIGLDGTWGFELADDLLLAGESTADFKFKKGKRRRKAGWLYHEIVIAVCKQFRIPVGSLVKGTKRIAVSDTNVSPLEIIRRAVEQESKWSGRRLLVVWRYDKRTKRFGLNVVPMRRNPFLYVFRTLITSATLTDKATADRATALIVRGSAKRGKKKTRKKVKVKITSPTGIRRYGYIQREESLKGNVDSTAEARTKGKRVLAKLLKPKPIIEDFEHPGIAFLRRGDAIRVSLPEQGFDVGYGKVPKKTRWDDPRLVKGVVFVVSVVHSVQSGQYTMQLTLGYIDPMDPNKIRKEQEAAARARKRKQRGKKKKG